MSVVQMGHVHQFIIFILSDSWSAIPKPAVLRSTWEVVRNENYGPHSRLTESETLRAGAPQCVLICPSDSHVD